MYSRIKMVYAQVTLCSLHEPPCLCTVVAPSWHPQGHDAATLYSFADESAKDDVVQIKECALVEWCLEWQVWWGMAQEVSTHVTEYVHTLSFTVAWTMDWISLNPLSIQNPWNNLLQTRPLHTGCSSPTKILAHALSRCLHCLWCLVENQTPPSASGQVQRDHLH